MSAKNPSEVYLGIYKPTTPYQYVILKFNDLLIDSSI